MPKLEKIDDLSLLKKKKIIIYGASATGEIILDLCNRNKVKIECFCDDSIQKQGDIINGVPVLSYDEIMSNYNHLRDGCVILALPQIEKVLGKLQNTECEKIFSGPLLLDEEIISKYDWDDKKNIAHRIINRCILSHKHYFDNKKIFLKNIDLVITERCSLKCKDCANLMQYYIKPADINLLDLQQSIDTLCNIADEINEVRVLGGEPFMNKDLHVIIDLLSKKENVDAIVIYTNATIAPREEQIKAFSNNKVIFSITDYGILSKKLIDMKTAFDRNHVAYDVHKASGWTACSRIKPHGRNESDLKKLLRDCCTNDTITLLKGKIYRCPFIANAMNLGAVPNEPLEYFDLYTTDSIFEKQQKLLELVVERESFKSCDYCDGRFLDAALIEPAIQITHPKKIPSFIKQY